MDGVGGVTGQSWSACRHNTPPHTDQVITTETRRLNQCPITASSGTRVISAAGFSCSLGCSMECAAPVTEKLARLISLYHSVLVDEHSPQSSDLNPEVVTLLVQANQMCKDMSIGQITFIKKSMASVLFLNLLNLWPNAHTALHCLQCLCCQIKCSNIDNIWVPLCNWYSVANYTCRA